LTVYLLKKFDDVSYATGSAMIIIELIVSIGICGILALAGAFFYFGEKTNILALSFLCLFLLGLLGWYGIRMYLLRGNKKRRPYKFTSQIQEAFSRISVSHVIMYTFLVLLGQLLAGITLVLLAVFLSEKLSLFQAIVVNSTAYFLGAISMIPMGLGTREASMLFYLGHLGISHEIGISIVAIQRLFSTGLSFLLGVIFGSIMGLKNGQRPPAKQKMTS
jgi:uncharacterized membrane protein YbhN (UPF0104 family)